MSGRVASHLLIVGPNGSGKTTLARELIRPVQSVVVIDTKRAGDYRGLGLTATPDLRRLEREPRCVWLAPVGAPPDEIGRALEVVFRRGKTVVVVDEALHACTASRIPRGYRACLVSGRGRGVQVVTLSQRLAGLHNDVLSESWHYVLFRLGGTDLDKARAWGVGEEALALAAELRRYEYVWWDREEARIRERGTTKRDHHPKDAGAVAGRRADEEGGEGRGAQPLPKDAAAARGGRAARGRRAKPGGAPAPRAGRARPAHGRGGEGGRPHPPGV
jgi:energy-coupling factor transporter ATP-binding protein EcfA2